MPQDPHLYGQRPAKKQKKEIPLSSSLAFTSQLTSLLSAPSSSSSPASTSASASASTTATTKTTTTSGRARPSKQKDDIFSVRAKRKNPPPQDGRADDDDDKDGRNRGGVKLKTPVGTEDEKRDLLRARRNMEEKARRYAAMKRGDYVRPGSGSGSGSGVLAAAAAAENAPLVDFDRKWAERHPEGDLDRLSSSSGSDNESDEDDGEASARELVEYKDEFGRTRTGTRAEAQRQLLRERRRRLGAEELEEMSARPSANPYRNGTNDGIGIGGGGIILGDVIQTEAFDIAGADPAAAAACMEELAARRDREPTPPADTHFDARAEVRHKGVGFYQFATDDAAQRAAQMDDLRARRVETERVRAERGLGADKSDGTTGGAGEEGNGEAEAKAKGATERDKRRALIEERRRKLGKARAEKLADSFLSGLAGEVGGGGGGGGGNGESGSKEAGDGGGRAGGPESGNAETPEKKTAS